MRMHDKRDYKRNSLEIDIFLATETGIYKYLKDKNIVLIEDNDNAGVHRVEMLLWKLKDIVKQIKVIRFKKENKGFDTTDYVGKY